MMNIKKNSGLKMARIFQNQLRNSASSRILYWIPRKTRELHDPQEEKNYNLKISNDYPVEGNTSSSFTYLLNDPINSTIYECGLVELKIPSVELIKIEDERDLLNLEFYNSNKGYGNNIVKF